jgi:hypothetical protein
LIRTPLGASVWNPGAYQDHFPAIIEGMRPPRPAVIPLDVRLLLAPPQSVTTGYETEHGAIIADDSMENKPGALISARFRLELYYLGVHMTYAKIIHSKPADQIEKFQSGHSLEGSCRVKLAAKLDSEGPYTAVTITVGRSFHFESQYSSEKNIAAHKNT